MISIPTLETGRLLLRQFRQSDFDALAALSADPEVMRYLGDGKPRTRAETWLAMASYLGHWELRGYGLWAVEEKATGKFVGRIGLLNPEGWPGLEVAWTLARERWGNGFATEGAKAALDYAFSVLKLEHVISLIHTDNAASIRVALRVGEKLEGQAELFGVMRSVYGIQRPGIQRAGLRVAPAE
jgi:RimJ/RimL family protein N-acetyltransferase